MCSRCRSTAYCSIECQQTDWSIHRHVCKSFKKLGNRPGKNFRVAFFFPTDSLSPKPVWIEIQPAIQRPTYGYDNALYDEYLKNSPSEKQRGTCGIALIRGNLLRGKQPNPNTIELTWRGEFEMDGSPYNDSIDRLGGCAWFSWKGPMIAMAKKGMDFDPLYYTDMTLRDFTDVVEYLRWYRDGIGSVTDGIGSRGRFAESILQKRGRKYLGVRVNCAKDMEENKKERFEAVLVPGRHPLYYEEGDDPSEVSEKVGLEICGKRYGMKKIQKGDSMDGMKNDVVEKLYTVIDEESFDWGRPEMRWRGNLGSVLLVRRFRKDLHVKEVELLNRFIKDKILPLMASEVDREKVIEQISEDKFQKYMEKVRQ